MMPRGLLFAALIFFLVTIVVPAVGIAEPFVPTDDGQILQRLAAPGDASKRELRRWRAKLSGDPKNLRLATGLATRYIQLSRAESDPRYNGYAQAALAPWWNLAEPPLEVLVLRATLRQNRHDFDAALDDLSRALAINPRNAQAWLTRAVILQVQGEYAEALQSCSRLATLTTPLATMACMSSVGGVSGRAAESYQRLREAVYRAAPADPRFTRWALTILAEIAVASGKYDAAEQHFREALSLGSRDGYLLGAYADFLLQQGRPRQVQALLVGQTRADGLLLRLALAEQRLGARELADHIEVLRIRFTANRLRGDTLHLRDEARFTLHLLNEPTRALALAQENWALQREPWDARLLLEAALAADEPAAAQPVLDWLTTSRLEDIHLQPLVAQLTDAQK